MQLWRLPQVVEWELAQLSHEVALYVRIFSRTESSSIPAAAGAWQRSDRLGLSLLAMARFRWEIVSPAEYVEPSLISRWPRRLAAVDPEDTGP